VPITYTSQEQVEVYRFSAPAAILIPLVALFLQAFLPLRLHFFSLFDLPLLVVIFFAVARRSQVSGMLTGALIGLLQDSLTHQPIGIYGIANTVVGFGASSLGAKLDVENVGARFLVTLFFYAVHEVVYFTVARGTGQTDPCSGVGATRSEAPCSTLQPRPYCLPCWTGFKQRA
jgi:rod shape-determining protein MreD